MALSVRQLRLLAIGALALGLATSLTAADEKSAVEERLLHDVKTLADDGFEGRGVGTDGLNRAADYVAEVFADAGVKERLSVIIEEVGHQVTARQREAALDWFERWLRK